MYDSGKIIAGLVIFVILITIPIWYNHGDIGAVPTKDPNLSQDMLAYANLPNGEKHPLAEEMRSVHMLMLKRFHANADAKLAELGDKKMPTMSCLGCHGSMEQTCDSCHSYAGVTPVDCWECHTKP